MFQYIKFQNLYTYLIWGIDLSGLLNFSIDSNGFEGEKQGTLYMATAQVSVLGEGDERPEDYFYVNAQHWGSLQKEGVGAEYKFK